MAERTKKKAKKQKKPDSRAHSFCNSFFGRIRLARDIFIVAILIVICAILIIANRQKKPIGLAGEEVKVSTEDEEEAYWDNVDQVGEVLASIDTANWKSYQNSWYGFELKYPEGWKYPASQPAFAGAKWEYRYKFRNQQPLDSDVFVGFDIVVYNIKKVKDIFGTGELSMINEKNPEANLKCQNIKWNLIEPWDCPAEEIHIPATDECYKPALFFSLTRNEYIYNFVTIAKEDNLEFGDPFENVKNDFPQFIVAASTLDLVDIKRSSPKPKSTAPKPVSYKIVDGRMVCAKKNDKPGKSKQDKDKHLDMECCLDPDEYPNPWCYYDPKKYGEYL